jgi:hypothetical protein
MLPATAAIIIKITSRTICNLIIPVEQNSPAVNSKESPGRKKPTKRPVSANTIKSRRYIPPYMIMLSGFTSCFKK